MRTLAHKRNQPARPVFPGLARSNKSANGLRQPADLALHPQRKIGNQAVQRMVQAQAEGHDLGRIPSNPSPAGAIQAKLAINEPGDEYEREADRVSEQVMRMPEPQPGQACACGGECPKCQAKREPSQARQVGSSDSLQNRALPIVQQALASPGQSLDSGTRRFMESRFGYDFSDVRVHSDAQADAASASIGARAFTLGADAVFRRGEYAPGTQEGRALLAHELTHVVQQRAVGPIKGRKGTDPIRQPALADQVQRKTPSDEAKSADPLCSSGYSYIVEKTLIEGQIDDLKATPEVETRLKLIRELKWVRRCGTEAEQSEIRALLEAGLGAKAAAAIWKEAGTAFGGYRGAYPGYYSAAKGRLERLGTSEVEEYGAFSYDAQSNDAAAFLAGREAGATAETPTLTATDLLYFYGHQYAQYNHPGVFANGTQTQFIDLRALAGKGDFSRVKLIVSTSCATCCKEAVETFATIFPNAVILGYRKSSPLDGGAVRNDFDKGIRSLKRPLLLEEPVDVNAIIEVWKSVVKRHHPNETKRLPGYYQSGTVHYLESGAWKSMPATDAGNACRVKGSRIEEAAD